MHSRVSYKTVAISLLYLYGMAIMQHRRTTAASMLQNGISQNTKCDTMVGFSKSGHIFQECTQLFSTNPLIEMSFILVFLSVSQYY